MKIGSKVGKLSHLFLKFQYVIIMFLLLLMGSKVSFILKTSIVIFGVTYSSRGRNLYLLDNPYKRDGKDITLIDTDLYSNVDG